MQRRKRSTPGSGSRTYRIHAVSELTGVPEATLRAWERRYGLLDPGRTSSGYRLYSEADLETVRRMRELCERGVAAAEAATLAREPGKAAQPAQGGDAFALAVEGIARAVARLDSGELERQVRSARTLASAVDVVHRVFMPAMSRVGRSWEKGELSIAHEHFATEAITLATRDMLRAACPSRPRGDVLLACFAEEDHVLPLYAAALWFAEWGYYPHVLGARLPPVALHSAVQAQKPLLIGLSATIAPPPARARTLVSEYAQATGGRPWLLGGAAAEPLRTLVERNGGQVVPPEAEATYGMLRSLLP